MPWRGQHATCISNNPEYHVASYKPDKQTMMFTIWRNGIEGCELNSRKTAKDSKSLELGLPTAKHVKRVPNERAMHGTDLLTTRWEPENRDKQNTQTAQRNGNLQIQRSHAIDPEPMAWIRRSWGVPTKTQAQTN